MFSPYKWLKILLRLEIFFNIFPIFILAGIKAMTKNLIL